jgi:hypothetical protein
MIYMPDDDDEDVGNPRVDAFVFYVIAGLGLAVLVMINTGVIPP